MRKLLTFIAMLPLTAMPSAAQRCSLISPDIRSLQVMADDRWMEMPVININSSERINIDFDDMTHEYHRYVYKIEHCDALWRVDEDLFASDYLSGFTSDNTIDDVEESVNTNQLYTHYHISLPNSKVQMRMSGNYKLTVTDGNSDDSVLTAFFMVYEPIADIGLTVSGNTDTDINHSHQQVGMTLKYNGLSVTRPEEEIKTVVLQNGRWDNAVFNAKPQYTMSDGLRWSHCRDYIFDGMNEYRKFETLDESHTTMGLEKIDWDGHEYHAYVWTDEPRPSYILDEGANGGFLIRNSDNTEVNTTCEYINVHFRLKAPQQDCPVYLNGGWTYDQFLPQYQMTWGEEQNCYEATILLKQGYYSYQYLQLSDDGTTLPVSTEGNFYETSNDYQALVYYRGLGQRTDRLVGYKKISTKAN